jgi:signal transduction histidine kinase/CheY-like chemotaxis protein
VNRFLFGSWASWSALARISPPLGLRLALALAAIAGLAVFFTLPSSSFQGNFLFPTTSQVDYARTYRVAYDSAPPFTEIQPDGKPGGLAIDVISQAAARTGIQIQWVRLEGTTPDLALSSNAADLWSIVGATAERAKILHLTEPWITNTFSIISHKQHPIQSASEVQNHTVSYTGFGLARRISAERLRGAILQVAPSRQGVLEAVCQGRATAAFDEAPYISWLLLNRPPACRDVPLHAILLPDAVARGAIASNYASARVADLLREEIARMAEDGTLTASLDRWASFSASETRSILEMQASGQQHQIFLYAFLVALLLAAALFFQARHSQAKGRSLALVLESTTDSVMLLDNAWTILFLNRRAQDHISAGAPLPSGGFLGQQIWRAFPEALNSPFALILQSALSDQRSVSDEFWFEPHQRFYAVQAHPSAGGLAVFFRDRTASIRAEREALQRRKQLDDVTSNIPGAVYQYRLSPDGSQSFPFISTGVLAIYGVSAQDVMQDATRLFRDVFPEDLPLLLKSIQDSAAALGPWHAYYRINSTSGTKWISGTSLPEALPNGDLLWTGVLMDVTSQKLAEEELADARDRAEAASRAKSAFLAAMSHEIRTPLNGILGTSEILLAGPLEAPQRELTNTIRTSGEVLLSVVNDILDYSKIEADKLELDSTPFSLYDTLENVADALGESADHKDLDLELRIDPDVPNSVIGDPLRLKQVLFNLVGNAIKFSEAGEVVISAAMISRPNGPFVSISVKDTGIGMSSELQTKLFQGFHQGDNSMSRRFGGTGLGLAISKRLVQLMHGTISVTSTPGKGSTFTIELPLCRNEAPSFGILALPAVHRMDRALLISKGIVPGELINVLTNASLKVSTLSMEALSQSGVTTLNSPQYADFAFCVFAFEEANLSGSLSEIISQAREVQPLFDGLSLIPVAVLPSRRRRTMAHLKRLGWTCICHPYQVAKIRSTLNHAKPRKALQNNNQKVPSLDARILVAEDNPVNQAVARGMLKRMNCEVEIANNGREAVYALTNSHFDLVLMDCQMPEVDGFQATALIRKMPGPKAATPIIAMTAHAIAGDRDVCLAAGMDDYITKPVRLGLLASVLAKWLRRPASLLSLDKQELEEQETAAPKQE